MLFVPLERLQPQICGPLPNVNHDNFPIRLAKHGYQVIDGSRVVQSLLSMNVAKRKEFLSPYNGLVPCVRDRGVTL